MAEEGPGGRVGPAGGLGWGEVLGPAGGSLGPVLVVVGGGGRVGACAMCPILGNICFSAESLHCFEHFDYLKPVHQDINSSGWPLILSC